MLNLVEGQLVLWVFLKQGVRTALPNLLGILFPEKTQQLEVSIRSILIDKSLSPIPKFAFEGNTQDSVRNDKYRPLFSIGAHA